MRFRLIKDLFSRLAGANLVTKSAIGLGAIGILSSLSYGIYALTASSEVINSIERYLTEEKFTITRQDEKGQWDKAFNTYELEKTGFEIGDIVKNGDDIRNWCSSVLSKEIKSKDDENFKKAKKWCTRYKTIRERMGRGKFVANESELNGRLSRFPKKIQAEINEIMVNVKKNPEGIKIRRWCLKNTKRRFTEKSDPYYRSINNHCLTVAPETIS